MENLTHLILSLMARLEDYDDVFGYYTRNMEN